MNKRERKKGNKGFTLIELLVVVAVVALLAVLVLFVLKEIKAKSRDARRVSDIKAIEEALNLYHNNHQLFPIYDGYITGDDDMSIALISDGAIQAVPTDPLNDNLGNVLYKYHYFSEQGKTYLIEYYLETDSVHGRPKGLNRASP